MIPALAFLLFAGSPLAAQDFDSLDLNPKFGLGGGASNPEVVVSYSPKKITAGETVTVNITLELPEDSYTYSQNPAFGGNTKIKLSKVEGLKPVGKGFTPDREPKASFDPDLMMRVEKFHADVTFSQKFVVGEDVTQAVIVGEMKSQVCDANTCKTPRFPIKLEIPVEAVATLAMPDDVTDVPEVEDFGSPEMKGVDLVSPEALATDLAPPPIDLPEPIQETKTEEVRSSRQEIQPTRMIGGEQKPYPVKFTVELLPENAKAGDTVLLSITAEVDGEYHIFATTQDPQMAGLPTKFNDLRWAGLEPTGDHFVASSKPETEKPLDDIIQKVHYGSVTWTREFKVSAEEGSDYSIQGTISFQLCNERGCIPPGKTEFALGNELSNSFIAEEIGNDDPADAGLLPFLLTAFLAGLAALATPCVFPMIPITVSFFLKQSEKGGHKPVTMASIYCLAIISGFTILGLIMAVFFGATSLNRFANNAWVNLVLAAIFIAFAFNLLGMFEIRVPSWLLSWSSQQEGKGGIIGLLFMALTYTLVSFTCTFAFVGGLLVLASKGSYLWPILGMAAFSTAFSLPFFFLALFPSMLKKLPQSGGWMNTVKVTLGLLELGVAFKFLSVMDLAWNSEPFFFDYGLVMSSWMVILLTCGFYLLGTFRLPHDTPVDTVSVTRFAFALTFLGFGTYIGVGVFGAQKPTGIVWEQIEAFAPPVFETVGESNDLGPIVEHDGLEYALDFDKAAAYAAENNLPMFLDFTGVNCVNCRKMENSVLSRAENHRLLEGFVRVQLYTDTDTIPGISSREEGKRIRERNIALQQEWFGDVTLPAYAVVSTDGQLVLTRLLGYQPGQGVFTQFLETGLQQWKRQQLASDAKDQTRR